MLHVGDGQVRPVGLRIASGGVGGDACVVDDDAGVADDVADADGEVVGVGVCVSGTSPEKVNVSRQRGQLRCRGVQSLKRIAS